MNSKYNLISWNVDTQRDFMETKNTTNYQGKLALENAMDIEGNLKKLTTYLQNSNIKMFGSNDYHNSNSSEFEIFPEHCIRGSYGAENIDATKLLDPLNIDWEKKYNSGELMKKIQNHNGEVIFQKDKFDVFNGNKYTTDIIKNLGVKNVLVYGVATDVCVDAAVRGFKNLGIQVYALTDCMRGINYENSQKAIESWKSGENPAKIVKLDNILRGDF